MKKLTESPTLNELPEVDCGGDGFPGDILTWDSSAGKMYWSPAPPDGFWELPLKIPSNLRQKSLKLANI